MIVKTVEETIVKHGLLKKKDNVLLAYSGGMDSTCLLGVMVELRKKWHLEIYLGHFNHRLRQNADHDEQFVRKVAAKLSLPVFVASADVRSYAKKNRLNMEEAGRLLRYDFLFRTARKIGFAKIATGHTLNDQAETFFLRLMRGSGLSGLSGIYPMVDGQVIRPLLNVERKDIETFVRKRGLAYREDESNFDRHFARNKIRLDLIPFIRDNFEPKIVQRIGKTVAIIQEEEDLLRKLSRREAKKAMSQDEGGGRLDLASLVSLPRGLNRRIIREFIHKLKGDLREITFEDVESLLELEEGESLQLTEDLLLTRENGQVFQKPELPARTPYEYVWEGSHPLILEELDLVIEAKKGKRPRSLEFDDHTHAFFDSENIQFPLQVRNRRDGDRYKPLGAPGRKKLKEIMRVKSIPLEERDKRPVFLSGGEIIWTLGLPVAEKHKVRKTTTQVLTLSVTPRRQR